MEAFKQQLLSKGNSKKTVLSHLRTVLRFKEWLEGENLEEDQVRYNDVLGYVQYLQKGGVKQKTVEHYLNSLKHYYRYLQELEIIGANPIDQVEIKGIKRKSLHDLFSKEELRQIYQQYQVKGLVGERNKVIVGLMVYQGLGSAELGVLKAEDLKLREGKLNVVGSRKSNARMLELHAFQIIDLQEYIYQTRPLLVAKRGKESTQLFISAGHSNAFRGLMLQLMRQLKDQHSRIKSSKQLRASVITNWLKEHNLRKVQYMAGHRYVSSTESYLVNEIEDLREDIVKYHPIQ